MFVLSTQVLTSQGKGPKSYICYRATKSITIDGRLDEQSWAKAAWTDFFVDIEGEKKPAPRFHTRAKMLWDDQYFYIGAELEEPHVWATITKRDSVIFHDNDFEVFIDPNGDNHEYYEFEMNALNTVWDLFLPKPYKDGGHAVDDWNIDGLKTGVSVRGTLNNPSDQDTGWTVEIAMPWKALAQYAHKPSPPHDSDQWRLNFSRVEWKHTVADGKYRKVPKTPEDNWVWSPQGVIDMHRPEEWGYIQFSTAPFGEAAFRPDPSIPLRRILHRIYYAQRKFFDTNKRWTGSLNDLDSGVRQPDVKRYSVTMMLTPEGFSASATVVLPDMTTLQLHIRQDSLVW
jgi:hypothetical protein